MKYFTLSLIILAAGTLVVGCSGGTSWQLRSGKIAIKEGSFERAIRNLDEEIARDPNSAEAWFLKGYSYEKLNDWINMSEAYARSLELSDKFKGKIDDSVKRLVHRYYKRFSTAFDSSDYDLAMTNLDTAIIIDSDNPTLYHQAAVAAFNGEMFDKAIDLAKKSIKYEEIAQRSPTDESEGPGIDVRTLILRIFIEKNDHDGMIEWAQKVMNLANVETDESNDYLQALDVIIEAYEAKEEPAKAEEAIKAAIDIFPEITDLKLNLATMMIRRDDFDNAMVIFQDVLKAVPDNIKANVAIGIMLVNQKKYKEAIPYLEKVLSVDEYNKGAISGLIQAYYNTGQEDKGRELREKLKE